MLEPKASLGREADEPTLPHELVLGWEMRGPVARWAVFAAFLTVNLGIPLFLWAKAGIIGLVIGVGGVLLGARNAPTRMRGARITPGEVEYWEYWFWVYPRRRRVKAFELKAVVLEMAKKPAVFVLEMLDGRCIRVPTQETDTEEELRVAQMIANILLGLQPGITLEDLNAMVQGRSAQTSQADKEPPSSSPETDVEFQDTPPSVREGEEVGFFIKHCTPRRPEVMLEGYGLQQLRSAIKSFNDSERWSLSSRAYQGHSRSLAHDAERIAELQYALGFPLPRVQFFLRRSGEAMLRCIELRGILETFEVTTSQDVDHRTGIMGEEKLQDVAAFVDVSMGAPAAGIKAAHCAWLARDSGLAARIANAIRFMPEDEEINGAQKIAELQVHLALLLGDEERAQRWAPKIDGATVRATILRGILESNEKLFNSSLLLLLEEYRREDASMNAKTLLEKGRGKTAPTGYWSVECLGLALLAYRRGVALRAKHSYLPVDLLDAAVEQS